MSFPNISDIDPYMNITFEDAIHLLLTSIAIEEVSLSKLMDAETGKLLHAVHACKQKKIALPDVIKLNKSVNHTVKDMLKLHMLLQSKLDQIQDLLPYASAPTPAATCSTKTEDMCSCSLIGKGNGNVTNCCDEFCGHMAELYAFILGCDKTSRTIRYEAGDYDANLSLCAFGCNIEVQTPCYYDDPLVICGTGRVEWHSCSHPDLLNQARFVLTVCNRTGPLLTYRMEITSDCDPTFHHDSGFIPVNSYLSDLCLKLYC